MSDDRDPRLGDLGRQAMRVAAVVITVGLAAGLIWTLASPSSRPAHAVLLAALALLIAFPAGNVIVTLVAEGRRREWALAAAAALTLGVLVYRFVVAFGAP